MKSAPPDLYSALSQHIKRYVNMSDDELTGVFNFLTPISLKKKQNLLIEGNVCHHNYFVSKGCLRMFFTNEKGIEQTTQFALENWWLADYNSFERQQPSSFYIQAVEKCDVLALHFEEQENMLREYPQMERYFRLIYQRAQAASQFRIRNLYNFSREDLYYQFAEMYPEFVQRIPQYLLASFLGFTPEYLSELRRKQFLKPV